MTVSAPFRLTILLATLAFHAFVGLSLLDGKPGVMTPPISGTGNHGSSA